MLRLIKKIPNRLYLACSGGPDSMAVLDFLARSRRDITVAYFNHGTPHGDEAELFIRDFCNKNTIPIVVGGITTSRPKGVSPEEYWRNQRHSFFNSLDGPVITAHNLDDVCEWWIFTSLNGMPRLMPTDNRNVSKPFLLTAKSDMEKWCDDKKVPYLKDPSNINFRYARSSIRHKIMPEALKINPGLRTVISKMLRTQNKGETNDIHTV